MPRKERLNPFSTIPSLTRKDLDKGIYKLIN